MRVTTLFSGRRVRRALLLGGVVAVAALASDGCASLHPDARWREAVRRAQAPEVTLAEPVTAPLRWERRFTLPTAYREGCDLASTPRGLVVAASTDALTVDGAAVFRWPDGGGLQTLLTWDGQGFLRVHAYGDTLLVPDADAPFHLVPFLFDLDVDGYVFVSDPNGNLTRQGRELLPAVYHVFDVARRSDGRVFASTGAYFPSRVPYVSEGAPAALFTEDGPGRPWRRVVVDPPAVTPGVFRFTFLEALSEGALMAGVESPRGHGAVRIDDPTGTARVTRAAGLSGFVLRWASRGEVVYAIEQRYDGAMLLRSTDGGRTFTDVHGVGESAQSMVVNDHRLHVLSGGALWVERDDGSFERRTAPNPALRHEPSSLVSAPLVVHRGRFWAASPNTGEVFEAVP